MTTVKPIMMFKQREGLSRDAVFLEIKSNSEDPNYPVILVCDRQDTACACMDSFFTSLAHARSSTLGDALLMRSVGLRLDGRRSLFDLLWVRSMDTIFAIDTRDNKFVCTPEQINGKFYDLN